LGKPLKDNVKVLFVSSGNRGGSPIVINQGGSLMRQGVNVDYYPIKGKGVWGYLSNVGKLRRIFKENDYDIVHAHYSLTAFVVSLAMASPLVVSLMGSDVKTGAFYRLLIQFFAFTFSWKTIIVKSEDMKASLKIDRAMVIPNGVDMNRFCELSQDECQKKLGWDKDKKHILFPANIARPVKNYELLEQAVRKIEDKNLVVHWFNNVPNEETPLWYNAADVVVMTSLWEGSPNAIKEAMACNRPIVSTNVGNVEWLFGETAGCYFSDYTVSDCAEKIRTALSFTGKTNGRQRIIDLGLSNESVAKHLVSIYKGIQKRK
jgi:glycosyltransferase involved in cell wall biosynthesis